MQKLTWPLVAAIIATTSASLTGLAQVLSCPKAGDVMIGWAANSTVTFNVSPLPTYMQAQVRAAFQAWNNDTALLSNVYFTEVTGSTSANFTLNTVPDSGQTSPAQSDHVLSANNTVLSTYTHINLNAKFADGSSVYNTDPNSAGFSTIWQKVAAHEIGHTMGLDDVGIVNQVQGGTEMNSIHNVNDTAGGAG